METEAPRAWSFMGQKRGGCFWSREKTQHLRPGESFQKPGDVEPVKEWM